MAVGLTRGRPKSQPLGPQRHWAGAAIAPQRRLRRPARSAPPASTLHQPFSQRSRLARPRGTRMALGLAPTLGWASSGTEPVAGAITIRRPSDHRAVHPDRAAVRIHQFGAGRPFQPPPAPASPAPGRSRGPDSPCRAASGPRFIALRESQRGTQNPLGLGRPLRAGQSSPSRERFWQALMMRAAAAITPSIITPRAPPPKSRQVPPQATPHVRVFGPARPVC